MFLSIVPCPISIHSKRTAARRRDPSSRLSKSERFVAFQVNHSWNNPGAAAGAEAERARGLGAAAGPRPGPRADSNPTQHTCTHTHGHGPQI